MSITTDLINAIAPKHCPVNFFEQYLIIADCNAGEQKALNACKVAHANRDPSCPRPMRAVKKLMMRNAREIIIQMISIRSTEKLKGL